MLSVTDRKLVEFFYSKKEELLRQWNEEIVVSNEDPFRNTILKNGAFMFDLIVNSLLKTKDQVEEHIRTFATEVATQRVKADINMGDFVYNVNLGRSVIHRILLKANHEGIDLQVLIDQINFCFDRFLYYAVTEYTEAKNKVIEEKTQFIDSTHKDRLTLLGQMTSSFIHEFRNPLTSIQGFVQLLKAENPPMKYLDIISNELEQLNFRISQFLLLSKKELIGKEKNLFSLNDLIDEVLIFLYPSILDGKVKIEKIIMDEIQLFGYQDEIRQVLINIIFNAIDVLSTFRYDPLIEIRVSIQNGTHVQLDISNNGPKIPESFLSSIFEPFVTNKELGTGLGLFVCREIIEKHKGNLTCHSDENKTVFGIILPLDK